MAGEGGDGRVEPAETGDESAAAAETATQERSGGADDDDAGATQQPARQARRAGGGGKDILEHVLGARGSMVVGSQRGLTQPEADDDDDDEEPLEDVLDRIKSRDLKFTILKYRDDEEKLAELTFVVFRGSGSGAERPCKRRMILFRELFTLAESGVPLKRDKIFNFLLLETSNMPLLTVPWLVEKALVGFKGQRMSESNGTDRWSPFELLPHLLMRMLEVPAGGVDPTGLCAEDYSGMDGTGFLYSILDEICREEWPPRSASLILSTMQEISAHLKQATVMELVQRALEQLRDVSYAEMPALVQNILLLVVSSASELGRQVCTLEEVIGIFEQLLDKFDDVFQDEVVTMNSLSVVEPTLVTDEATFESTATNEEAPAVATDAARERKEELRQLLRAQGSVLSHFSMLVSKNLDLGRAVLRAFAELRGGTNKPGVFHTAILLGMARVKRLEKQVLVVLHDRLRTEATHREKSASSPWLEEWVNLGCQGTSRNGDMKVVFGRLAVCSAWGGWDTIVQSLGVAGFHLMDARSEVVASLGVQLLGDSFANHSIVQRDVMECVKMRLAAGLPGAGVAQVNRLIARVVEQAPHVLINDVNAVKDMLAQLPRLPPGPALNLLKALQPLLQIRTDLIDFCVIVFRKALFQRDLQPRLVAVLGFLFLIQSSASSEQAVDIVNGLQRCLVHQADVRCAMYAGLAALNTPDRDHHRRGKVDPLLAHVARVLKSHLNTMLRKPMALGDDAESDEDAEGSDADAETGKFPFLLEQRCVDRVSRRISDPLSGLVEALDILGEADCVRHQRTMVAEFSGSAHGVLRGLSTMEAKLLPLQVCEVLIHSAGRFDAKLWAVFADFAHAYRDAAAERQLEAAGKAKKVDEEARIEEKEEEEGNSQGARELPRGLPCVLSVEQLLSILAWDDLPPAVREYAMHALSEALQTRQADSSAETSYKTLAQLAAGQRPDNVPGLLQRTKCVLSPGVLKSLDAAERYEDHMRGLKACLGLAIRHRVLDAFLEAGDDKVDVAIDSICACGPDTVNAADTPSAAYMTTMLECLQLLAPFASANAAQELREWLERSFLDATGVKNAKLVEAIFRLHLMVEEVCSKGKHDLGGAIGLAQSLESYLGVREDVFLSDNENDEHEDAAGTGETGSEASDLENESKSSKSTRAPHKGDHHRRRRKYMFGILDDRTVPVATMALLKRINAVMDECEWVVQTMQADRVQSRVVTDPIVAVTGDSPIRKAEKSRRTQEKAVHVKLLELVRACGPLVVADLTHDKAVEQMLKFMMRFYKLLFTHLKSCVALKLRCAPATLQRLLRAVRQQLTRKFYLLVLQLENSQASTGHLARQGKLVPNIVFQIEQYDLQLLKLSRLQRGGPEEVEAIAQCVCPSRARDFQIKFGADKKEKQQQQQNRQKDKKKRRKKPEPECHEAQSSEEGNPSKAIKPSKEATRKAKRRRRKEPPASLEALASSALATQKAKERVGGVGLLSQATSSSSISSSSSSTSSSSSSSSSSASSSASIPNHSQAA